MGPPLAPTPQDTSLYTVSATVFEIVAQRTLDAPAANTTELFVRRFTLKAASSETLVGLLTLMAMPDATIDAALTIHRPSR